MDVQERVEKDELFRDRLIGWLALNGINADHVPHGEQPSIVDGQLTLRMYTLSAAGGQQIDPLDDTRCLTHTVTVPVTVEPDAEVASWLTPPCSSCGR
jgi:hypothetical protein